MEIPGISDLDFHLSDEIKIHGIPWKVEVTKSRYAAQKCLAAFLYCLTRTKSPNWSLSGMATFKLLAANGAARPHVCHSSPQVFDSSGIGYGVHKLIGLNDLGLFVNNDTINLNIEVDAENPNDPNRSRLSLKCLHKCCNNRIPAKVEQCPEFDGNQNVRIHGARHAMENTNF